MVSRPVRRQPDRVARAGTEAQILYEAPNSELENTLDYWAGYAGNPEDARRLSPLIKELRTTVGLLKEVGSFKGAGDAEPVFDLGGNVAELGISAANEARTFGGSADLPVDAKSRVRPLPSPEYIGFRVFKETLRKDLVIHPDGV